MVQVVLIVLIVVFIIILLGINLYLLALYIHPDDKGLGNVVYMKILVILGLTLAQAQALMIPLDVANRSSIELSAIDMASFWFFLYIVVLLFIAVIIPYAIFFYETDQDDGICKRLGIALCYTTIAIIVVIVILLASWGGLRFVNLPFTKIQLNVVNTQANPNNINISNPLATATLQTITLQASFPVYIIAILSFFGWVFLAVFGGVGITALPIDLINEFRFRPKPRHSNQMRSTKDKMVTAIANMMKQGQQLQKLDQQHEKNAQAGWWQKWKNGRDVNNKFTEFKAKYHALSQQFNLFNEELKYSDSNPVVPFLKLFLGIIFIITSIIWLLQILIGNVIKSVFERPLIPLLNQLFIYLQQKNAGFVATGIFAYLCMYLLWCVQKGNIKFGIRVPCCCRFHPMKQNQTWMNSFLFNVILLLIASVGIVQLCISSFPTYTRNTDIYMIFGVQVRYMRFYDIFYRYSVFHIIFLIWALLTFIYQLCTCNKKPKYMRDIERIRQNQEE